MHTAAIKHVSLHCDEICARNGAMVPIAMMVMATISLELHGLADISGLLDIAIGYMAPILVYGLASPILHHAHTFVHLFEVFLVELLGDV
jgi:hypothetical protein